MTTPIGIPNEAMTRTDMEDVACLAVGTYLRTQVASLSIQSICQRASNPCLVEVDYTLVGTGTYDLDLATSAFSLDSTNGINGTWHRLTPLTSDAKHTPTPLVLTGSPQQGRFVANLCDHVSTFLEDPKIVVRLTFTRTDV